MKQIRELQFFKEKEYIEKNLNKNAFCNESIFKISCDHDPYIILEILKEMYPNDNIYFKRRYKLHYHIYFIEMYRYQFYTRDSFLKRVKRRIFLNKL
jgi:hypothetical protein